MSIEIIGGERLNDKRPAPSKGAGLLEQMPEPKQTAPMPDYLFEAIMRDLAGQFADNLSKEEDLHRPVSIIYSEEYNGLVYLTKRDFEENNVIQDKDGFRLKTVNEWNIIPPDNE